jgi:release factor glutamine methyltransferase
MQSTIQYIQNELNAIYPKTEIDGFIRILFEAVCGFSYTDLVLKKSESIQQNDFEKIKRIILRLKEFEPIQYILGETEFYGLKLNVNPSVLIPRPETEELVNWIISENEKVTGNILDIGTGSACIALSLKATLNEANVFAIDISEEALETAKINANINKLNVVFQKADILNWKKYNWENYTVIVSNPPYVRVSEKQKMEKNVLNFESENALFVPDENPLLFYQSIAEFSKKYLQRNGKLYFEINEALAQETKLMLAAIGYENIEIKKDINGKDRMIRCIK